ncbi:MAG TPA: nucleotidyltransferase domain-containing protein [Terriglobia bacterium]|nr:nucleotidyltransferase domain-containing protein [Terriglobia bacterium]
MAEGITGSIAAGAALNSSRSLDRDLIAEIVRRIVGRADPDKIIIFGSRARGDARPDSDVDVLVIKESDEPGYRRDAALYRALAGLNAPVDVLIYTPEEIREWSAVPQAFATTALREGQVVYEREGCRGPRVSCAKRQARW